MFKQVISKVDATDALKQYLEAQMKEANKEMDKFAKHQDLEKERLLKALAAQKEAKMEEILARQQRLFNWEEKLLADEERIKEQFKR